MEVHVYSDMHHAKIQKADLDAWKKFDEAGTIVTRLSQADVEAFTKLAVPLWYNWANKDKNAARIFKIHLDYMMSGSPGYVTPDMIKDKELKIQLTANFRETDPERGPFTAHLVGFGAFRATRVSTPEG